MVRNRLKFGGVRPVKVQTLGRVMGNSPARQLGWLL